MNKAKIIFSGIVFLILLFMLAPVIITFVVAFNATDLVVFPPASFSLRWFVQFFLNRDFLDSTRISLVIATVATLIVLFLSIPAAFSIKKYEFIGKRTVEIFLLSPLFIPRILVGVALLVFFVKLKILGSLAGIILAHIVILIPYGVRLLLVGFYGIDPSVEEAALCLGAHPVKAFLKVTLPLLKSGLVGAAMFSFIISFTDILLALFLCGPKTVTIQLRIFNYLEWHHDPFVAAIGVIQIIGILIGTVVLEKTVGLERLF